MNSVLNIREMDVDDVPSVVAIEHLMYPFPWTEGIFRDCLAVGCYGYVLEFEGRVVGYSVLSSGAGEAHVLNLCVDAPFSGRGFGRRLLAYCLDVISRQEVNRVFLEVRVSNFVAISLYHSVGFKQVGRRRDYYPDVGGRREDALVLAYDMKNHTGATE